ncbi:uncharacterized protein LOC8275702 [Ricinus communis]|uniref:Uncharacterized protein n=1 Tax=Ricinus communis TaxID=3988 RepID=B9T2M1_RICCO|nr:uncharacterized protein LOC8275702 [Ricinus communis]EEF29889.1 hypothetical protein RCOM_0171040 [Ricinus communis]|eukprot:XP_002532490.1 uncharacterized protein LOC8275702 [Ricinus communis]
MEHGQLSHGYVWRRGTVMTKKHKIDNGIPKLMSQFLEVIMVNCMPETSSPLRGHRFQHLPAAILALVSPLSLEDREVLAYMITRSNPSLSCWLFNKPSKNQPATKCIKHDEKNTAPRFSCDCFHCYTSYWFKWDSSPNRELIHQFIEVVEADPNLFSSMAANNRKIQQALVCFPCCFS